MAAPAKTLVDDAARRDAMAVHDRSFLVEAGAGSGKTAVMAGRIALLLARGVPPKAIAAVTFTELAASELFIRVKAFVDALTDGTTPPELQVALPDGLSVDQRRRLAAAREAIDDMTCSTIHGFCQRLITPYPVEAGIDPGAAVMDRDQGDLAFAEIVDAWLRSELADEANGLLAELVLHDPDKTVRLIRTILEHLRRHRTLAPCETEDLTSFASAFLEVVDDFCRFMTEAAVQEPETEAIAARFQELAEEIDAALPAESPSGVVVLLTARPHPDLLTKGGTFLTYRKKGKWGDAARRVGLAKADGDRLNDSAATRYSGCCAAWNALQRAAAARALADLVPLLQPVMERFRDYKRSAALLDFDDLIFNARDLLRENDEVRRALAKRYTHVLVDEFQDTDPLQTEIFWRLCGDSPADGDNGNWPSFALRPGALFLVGDPKQAIYRFRGADIAAYLRAREAFAAQVADGVLSITTNFRSCPPIMHYVNGRFEGPLAAENGQPGFQALDAFLPERAAGPSVVALDIKAAGDDGKANTSRQRDSEAEAVAEACARLIGSEPILDPDDGELRPCRAGDIALLAPTGSELWRYEEALEERGIPVATQAGKGLFQRQEIQDLIAVTRVLADQRDTLALGALLRGPLVGLTEEELLDIVWDLSRSGDKPDDLPRPDDAPDDLPRSDDAPDDLPRSDDAPDDLPRLHVGVSPENITHPLARDIVEKLQTLRRQVNATTPHHLLSQAVDVLRVRPILLRRHRGQAERALANVDLYLSFSRAYAVRGLRAFAEAMTAAWTDASRAVEGRPDAQEEAVALYTMHAAKGLEWPVVIPVNTMTQVRTAERAVTDRASGRFYCPVFGVEPEGFAAVLDAEKLEFERERVRLWYVAATRARELLVLPRLDVTARSAAWVSVVDLALPDLPALDLGHHPLEIEPDATGDENTQTRSVFASQAEAIAASQRRIVWHQPSRAEAEDAPANGDESTIGEEGPSLLATDGEGTWLDGPAAPSIQGGRERGLILHKLLEEVLTGETEETTPLLTARAETLIRSLGHPVTDNPAQGLVPAELAGSVLRALSIPQVAELRPRLQPEFPVYASTATYTQEEATAGVVDAIAFAPDGTPEVVIDWKSDVDPSPETIQHYCAQVRAYLDTTGAPRGLVVAVTSGTVVPVAPTRG